jgi:ketosteroid isomerase-like protein
MTRLPILSLAVLLLVLPTARAQESEGSSEAAMHLAKKITKEGAASFNKCNAKIMAAYYTSDAVVVLTGKDPTGYKNTVYKGRAEIEKLYADLFKNSQRVESTNTVEMARLIEPDMLLIYGTFEPSKDSKKLPFFQVRVRQGDKWLISKLQVFVLPQN